MTDEQQKSFAKVLEIKKEIDTLKDLTVEKQDELSKALEEFLGLNGDERTFKSGDFWYNIRKNSKSKKYFMIEDEKKPGSWLKKDKKEE